MTEIGIVLEEIRFISRRLKKWAKPKKAKTAVSHIGSKSIVIAEPYGTVLIIAPWNYPFQLAVSPLIGALAAGNTGVIKPSELAPAVSSVISKMIKEIFPPEYVSVIEGGVETNQELLRQKFDYIFFTGSVPVGKVVMEAAAKQLIPVTLELGGKSPCIVHKDADLKLAAQRIVFGKLTNAGQTCIAPDYLLVHKDVKSGLLHALKQSIQTFYGKAPESHPAYGKIISERHFERLLRFLHNENIVTGGTYQKTHLKLLRPLSMNPTGNRRSCRKRFSGRSFLSSAMKQSKTLSKWFKAALNRSRSICLRMKNRYRSTSSAGFHLAGMHQ